MLVRSDIHRSIARMTLDLHKATDARRHRADDYGIGERECQSQYDFNGTSGTLPVEAEITIEFTVAFVPDPGYQRDSNLDRPHAKLTIEMTDAPAGLMPYAYVARWVQDNAFNYTGAIARVGAHDPSLSIRQPGITPTSKPFRGILHASFQGWGTPIDAAEMLGGTTSEGEELF